jgi:TP901 family phage tail tape measure protein
VEEDGIGAGQGVEYDFGIDASPALRELAKVKSQLEGINAALQHTKGIVAAQTREIARDYQQLISALGSGPETLGQRLALRQRQFAAQDRGLRHYEQYGPEATAGATRDLMVAFRRQLNSQRQEVNRLVSTLMKDTIQGSIDAIRTQVEVAQARISEEYFKAASLVRRTTTPALAARNVLDVERVDRQIREAAPERVAFRERRYVRRVGRESDATLQDALAARQAETDKRLIYRYSEEGQAELKRLAEDKAERERVRREKAEVREAERQAAKDRIEAARREREELKNSAEYRARATYRRDLGLIRDDPEARAARLAAARRSAEEAKERNRIGDVAYSNQRIQERISDPSFLGVQATLMTNYAAISGVFNSLRAMSTFIVDLDREFKQFQAISQATNTEMDSLRLQFIQVGQASKFTSVEIAQAATTMAQAGLSANEVAKSIGAVVNLATASGSTLQESVDLVTSVIGAFNLQGSETGKIADVVTEALNRTKLTVDKLALGIQYSGNVAADVGITYTELTAILGTLSQTGIRSGSTLGTGLRQLLVDLEKPTDAFKQRLEELGLTLQDVDVKTNGFMGVLSKLRQAGFTAGDAIGSFEVRAAAAYTALANNVSTITQLNTSFQTTTASAKAAATQMESLSNIWTNFLSKFGSNAYIAFEPLMEVLKVVLKTIGDVTGMLSQVPGLLQTIGTAFAGLATIFAGAFFLKAATGIFKFVGGIEALTLAMGALRVVSLGHPLIGLATILVGLGAYFLTTGKRADDFASSMERIDTAANAATGRVQSTVQSIQAVNNQIRTLIQQQSTLDRDPALRSAKIAEVRAQFANLGLEIDNSTNSIGALIEKLDGLNQRLSQKLVEQYGEQIAVLNRKISTLDAEYDRKARGYDSSAAPGLPAPKVSGLGLRVQEASQLLGAPVAVPQTADEFSALTARLRMLRAQREEEQEILRNKDGQTYADEKRIAAIDTFFKRLDKTVRLLDAFGQNRRDRETALQERDRVTQEQITREFQNSPQATAITQANRELEQLRAGAQNRVTQSTDADTTYRELRQAEEKLLENQKQTLEAARDALAQQGRTPEQIQQILQSSQDESTKAKAELDKTLKDISEAPLKLLKKKADDISNRIEELGRSVNVNNSIEKIDEAIAAVASKVAEKINAVAQSTEKFGFVQPGAASGGTTAADLSPAARGLLNTIASVESGGRYDIINGGGSFSDFSRHPREGQRGSSLIASGRYQFLPSTWAGVAPKIGATDFGPENQDKGAWFLAQQDYKARTGRDLATDLQDPSMAGSIRRALVPTWTGLGNMNDARFAAGLGNTSTVAQQAPQAAGIGNDYLAAYRTAQKAGLNPADFLATIQSASKFDRNAPGGLFGLTDEQGFRSGLTSQQELDLGAKLMASMKADLANALGRDPTGLDLNLAKKFGVGTATKAVTADPNAKAADVLGNVAGTRPGQSVGEFIAAQNAIYNRSLEGTLEVTNKLANDLKTLDALGATRDRAQQRQESARLTGESRLAQERLDTLSAQARGMQDPAAIEGLISQAQKLVPEIVGKQIESLRKGRFAERIADGDETVADDLKAEEDRLKETLKQRIQKIVDAKYDAMDKEAKKPLELAKDNLERLRDDSNATTYERVQAETAVQDQEILYKKEQVRIATERQTEAERLLAEAIRSKDLAAEAAATERLADAKNSAADAQRNYNNAAAQQPDMSFEKATKDGTYNFLNSQGLFDKEGQLKSGAQQWGQAWTQILSGVSDQFANFSSSMVKAPGDWKDALKQWGSSFIDMLIQIISKALALQVIMGLFGDGKGENGLLGGLFGGGGNLLGGLFGASGSSGGGGLGGLLPFATGGRVRGGIPNRDSVPAKLMPGEVVMNAPAVRSIGEDKLLKMNRLGKQAFDDWKAQQAPEPANDDQETGGTTVNVWIVPPEEKPQMGPNDVVAIISDNIQRRGPVRQLIKQIKAGA